MNYSLISFLSGKKWTERRKLLTPAFHFSILNTFFRPIVENCNGLIEKLKSVEDSEEIDIYPYINNCTLDIICGEFFISLQSFKYYEYDSQVSRQNVQPIDYTVFHMDTLRQFIPTNS